MSAKLLEGKPIAEKIKQQIKQDIEGLGRKPVLASILAGDNAGALAYVRSQQKNAEALGIEYCLEKLESNITEAGLVDFVRKLNQDKSVNGIIIQMPLPEQIDYKKISSFIAAEKDIEGMNPQNMGKIVFGSAKILPCTPAAVMELLKETAVDLCGKEVVVVGHSEIVGKPLSLLLLDKLATVSVCHIGTSKAGKLEEHVKKAEVLIVAVGRAGLIKGEWVKDGAIVIDVGINRVADKIVGDVEFEAAASHASWITPVPGGVGPLTVTMLMRNLVEAAKLQK
ncbi:MAG: bifunctional 5,10-methylenetetrahydrofolate dehydrogenase/5,10-methenyltetrahydrofolate cyclohydrolase [Candidatus Omnitrophica bacterium]|nr:bifunctional 5,10-methylenetetrahydrofolate dehydrogenase/5,10-methenyltetrahydrofolate cyclohydrolase [Candidatus Omnitrophota bacterium]MDD5610883.1 bifunctional 5,10-methylenetetrahydrofolate dehydrogenase/5,10-methenyltetrahydrofolate cyclohydrolase [Candidatus Omnitrophota bacterium]